MANILKKKGCVALEITDNEYDAFFAIVRGSRLDNVKNAVYLYQLAFEQKETAEMLEEILEQVKKGTFEG